LYDFAYSAGLVLWSIYQHKIAAVSLSKLLIHREDQFASQRKRFIDYAGCAAHINLRQIKNNLIVIFTTQRTGSTLMCQDIASALRLNYSPTESFVPILTGFSKHRIKPEEISERVERVLQSFADSPFTVIKLMIDYAGWLGFLCSDRDMALNSSYTSLSSFFLDKLKCADDTSFSRLVRLDRKNKLKQAVSRLINSMGLPTHIENEKDSIEFEKQLSDKLVQYPDYPSMIVDQLGIILRQTSMLDDCLEAIAGTTPHLCYEFESDLLINQDFYMTSLLNGSGYQISSIQRNLMPTSGKQSREMLQKLLQTLSFDA
jgi:hypothetical protein